MTLSTAVQTATLVALALGVWQLNLTRIQRQRDFESLFVQRFWSILDRLSEPALAGTPPADGQLSDQDRHAIISYFRLCEDELELWQDGWITSSAWRQWRAGIDASLRRWPFSAVWAETCKREDQAGSTGQFVTLRHWRHPDHPLDGWPRRRRWWR